MRIPRGPGVVSNRQTTTGQVESGQTQQAVGLFSTALGFVQKYNEEKDRSQIQEAINTATKKTNDWKIKNLARTGKEAEGLTEEFLKFNQETENELNQGLSRNARSAFSEWNLRNSENDKMGVMMHQKKQDDFVKQSAFNDGINIAQETIRTDAKSWPRAYDHLQNTLDLGLQSGVIKQEEFEKTKTEITNKLRTDLGKNYYTQDKHSFMKEIDSFGFGEPEIAFYKNKYQNDLAAEERERKTLFSEEAKLLYGKRDDMKAQALANSDTSHYFESADKLEKMGYKEWAVNLREEGGLYQSVVSFNEQNKNRPLGEIAQEAQNLGVGKELDGASAEYKSMLAIQNETKKQIKLFNSDPAEYVSRKAQGGNLEEISSSRLSLQEDQKLFPKNGFQILTQNEKNTFKATWESGDNAQKTELVMESFRYGKHTPKILDEVGVNSALSLAPIVGFHEGTGLNKKDIEILVAGVSSKAEILEDVKASEYKAAAKESDFYQNLLELQKKFPTNPDLAKKLKDVESAMVGIGAKMVDSSAGAKFFDERIETLNSGDKTIYFPKSLDDDDVESVLDAKKDELTSKFQTGDRLRDNSARWAMRDAVWINTASGFVLADPNSGAFIEGSQVDLIDLEPSKKDLAKKKLTEADSQNVTFMRR